MIVLYARISDNVMDPEDWPVRLLFIEGERIVYHAELPHSGLYRTDDMPGAGWSLNNLVAWTAYDVSWQHPKISHDIKVNGDEEYAIWIGDREQLSELLEKPQHGERR